jgi:hypothetical protein
VDAPRRDRVNRAGRLGVERVWRLKMTRHQGALRSPAQARDTRAPLTTPLAQPAQSAAAPPEGGTFRVCNTAIVLGRPPHRVYPHGHGDDTFPSTVVFQVWM